MNQDKGRTAALKIRQLKAQKLLVKNSQEVNSDELVIIQLCLVVCIPLKSHIRW